MLDYVSEQLDQRCDAVVDCEQTTILGKAEPLLLILGLEIAEIAKKK